MRILVVDEKVSANITAMSLRNLTGAEIEVAHKLNQAFIMLFEQQYDLIIIDNASWDFNVFDIIALIKKRWPEIKIIICATSAFTCKYHREGLYLGANRVLNKTGGLEEMLEYIKDMIANEL